MLMFLIGVMHNIVFLREGVLQGGCGIEEQKKYRSIQSICFVTVKQLYTLVQWKIISRNGI